MHSPRLLYLNGGFDLSFTGAVPEKFRRLLGEMTLWFAPAGTDGDRIVLESEPHREYWKYLRGLGLTPPEPAVRDGRYEGLEGMPWGWDEGAAEKLSRLGARCAYPGLETVRKVNSREFSFMLGQKHGYGAAGARLCRSTAETCALFEGRGDVPLVVKPAFGNAGIGFVKVLPGTFGPKHRPRIESLFASGNPCVTVEPWLDRKADIGTRFELGRTGETGPVTHHRSLATSGGASYGMLFDPQERFIAPYRKELDAMAGIIAKELAAGGYFGPVNIDSMVVRTPQGAPRLVPMLEINARLSMGFIGRNLWEKLAPANHCLFRTLGIGRHRLPETYEELRRLLGPMAYRPGTREGVAVMTPLRSMENGALKQPDRSLLFLAAASEERLCHMDRQLSACIGIRK
jgi:hypothetical protein